MFHDIKVREFGLGAQTRLEIVKNLGIPFKIVPKFLVPEGIELVQEIFSRRKDHFFKLSYKNFRAGKSVALLIAKLSYIMLKVNLTL